VAVIERARVAAAHEGDAELVVGIRYNNGGCSDVVLDAVAAAHLLDSCEATTLEQLAGHSWQKVQQALSASYNRFNQ